MTLAGGLLLIGYGAKAGLFPFHTWLADAHSQAPAPVGALMSGVLLSVAFSVLIRIKPIIDAAAGPDFLRTGLLVVGLATLLVAALMLTVTGDVKRMLAYSSMENMGLIAIAAAAGTTLAIAALLLHVLAHGIGKTVLFLAGGQLQVAHGSTTIADITGVARRSRLIGVSFAVGLIVLLGLPPFAMFASELAIARSLADARLAWVLGAAMLLIAVAFAALVRNSGRMLLGAPAACRARRSPCLPPWRPLCSSASPPRSCSGLPRDRSPACSPPPQATYEPSDEAELVAAPAIRRRATDKAEDLLAEGFRLGLVAAHDDGDRLRVVYLFLAGRPDRRVELECLVPAADPALQSLAYLSFPVSRFEREMADLYGIRPIGHPRPRRLVRHAHWPEDWHPMRSRRRARTAVRSRPAASRSSPSREPGCTRFPVGPVHAGLIEPGHFRFSVVGETVLRLKARLWFVHRGLEKLFEGRSATGAVDLAERISGDTSAAHALAHSLAVEDALGIEMPDEAQRLRALLVELERLYNHAADLGALANDVGFGLANAHAQRIREQLLRLNATVTGHRLLRGAIHPGAVTLHDLPDTASVAVHRRRPRRGRRANAGQRRGLRPLRRHRRPGLRRCPRDGLPRIRRPGQRHAHRRPTRPSHAPCCPSPRSGCPPATSSRATPCDATSSPPPRHWPAISVESHTGPTEYAASTPPNRATGSGIGIVEGWRGTIVHRVEIDGDAQITRAKIVDPSWFNWPALPVAMADTIVPDFPLTNKSFNLSYAGNDL